MLPKSVSTPTLFIAGKSDWGIYQKPGDLDKMRKSFFKNFFGVILINNAGHWVQQENPDDTCKYLVKFYRKLKIIK